MCIQSVLYAGSWSASHCFASLAIRDLPEEVLGRRQHDIRDGLPPELPKRAGVELQVFGRERSEAIAHERHTLERDFD